MISSVIAKFDCDEQTRLAAIRQISSHPALEAGDLVENRSLPCTIDANSNQETEQVTRWLMALDGVAFVDVVFVHFEKDDQDVEAPRKRNRAVPNLRIS